MRWTLLTPVFAAAALSGCTTWPDAGSTRAASASPPGIYVAQADSGRGNGRLPPGIAKRLERGKPLPPGIAKRRVPPAQLRDLPPARDGFEYLVVAGKIVLIESATQIVHDILTDALFD